PSFARRELLRRVSIGIGASSGGRCRGLRSSSPFSARGGGTPSSCGRGTGRGRGRGAAFFGGAPAIRRGGRAGAPYPARTGQPPGEDHGGADRTPRRSRAASGAQSRRSLSPLGRLDATCRGPAALVEARRSDPRPLGGVGNGRYDLRTRVLLDGVDSSGFR